MKQAALGILLLFALLDYFFFETGAYIALIFVFVLFVQGDSSAHRLAIQRFELDPEKKHPEDGDAQFEEFLETEPLHKKRTTPNVDSTQSKIASSQAQGFQGAAQAKIGYDHSKNTNYAKAPLSQKTVKTESKRQEAKNEPSVPKFAGKPHEILGIRENAPTKMILGAFRKWIKTYHPDTANEPLASANDKARRLKEAKESLLKKRRQKKDPAA